MTNPSVAIVTCYHFDNSSKDQAAYQWLLRSFCASLQQLITASGDWLQRRCPALDQWFLFEVEFGENFQEHGPARVHEQGTN